MGRCKHPWTISAAVQVEIAAAEVAWFGWRDDVDRAGWWKFAADAEPAPSEFAGWLGRAIAESRPQPAHWVAVGPDLLHELATAAAARTGGVVAHARVR